MLGRRLTKKFDCSIRAHSSLFSFGGFNRSFKTSVFQADNIVIINAVENGESRIGNKKSILDALPKSMCQADMQLGCLMINPTIMKQKKDGVEKNTHMAATIFDVTKQEKGELMLTILEGSVMNFFRSEPASNVKTVIEGGYFVDPETKERLTGENFTASGVFSNKFEPQAFHKIDAMDQARFFIFFPLNKKQVKKFVGKVSAIRKEFSELSEEQKKVLYNRQTRNCAHLVLNSLMDEENAGYILKQEGPYGLTPQKAGAMIIEEYCMNKTSALKAISESGLGLTMIDRMKMNKKMLENTSKIEIEKAGNSPTF